MKSIKSLLVLAFFLNACQQPAESDNSATSLEDKRALLVEKRSALQSLTNEIENLESEIAELDPAATATKKLVTTRAVEKRDFQRYAEIQGTVEADETAGASAEVPGRLLSVTVKEGDRVRKGQLIATLDMDQVNKQLAEIDKSLELAEDVFARQERLWKQNI
ncbi:MAG: biotin/lipoyl-binding protein, partial [Bacteroidota bacterium]